MPRGILNPIVLPKGYTSDMSLVVLTNSDPPNGHMFRATGKECVYAKGLTGGGNVIILPSYDPYGRVGSNLITNLPGAGYDNMSPVFPIAGWAQPDGFIYIDVSSLGIGIAVLQIPDFPDGPSW